jgi:hypothetical protein
MEANPEDVEDGPAEGAGVWPAQLAEFKSGFRKVASLTCVLRHDVIWSVSLTHLMCGSAALSVGTLRNGYRRFRDRGPIGRTLRRWRAP